MRGLHGAIIGRATSGLVLTLECFQSRTKTNSTAILWVRFMNFDSTMLRPFVALCTPSITRLDLYQPICNNHICVMHEDTKSPCLLWRNKATLLRPTVVGAPISLFFFFLIKYIYQFGYFISWILKIKLSPTRIIYGSLKQKKQPKYY